MLSPWSPTLCLIAAAGALALHTTPHTSPSTQPHASLAAPPLAKPRPPPAAVPAARRTVVTRPPATRNAPAAHLVKQGDAWRSVAHPRPLVDTVSDATLSRSTSRGGHTEWSVKVPITFGYRVREVSDVLDPSSLALLFGHLEGDPSQLAKARSRPLKRVVVVDQNVYQLYGERIDAYFAHHGVQTRMLVLPTDEEHKDMETVLGIAAAIHELGIDRRLDPLIAIGGGVCMDIAGFAASIYRRRTPYVRVPTTLMGYVDASIGAKTGVNFAGKKNKLGAYLPPALTLLDKSFLCTLESRQLSNGAAEIAKMAFVKDPELFGLLEAHGRHLISGKFQRGAPAARVLDLAIHTMLEELAPNLWEDSLERLVDYGHVFSMELEMDMLFHDKLYHGEAVAIDMAFSTVLAHVRGELDEATLDASLRILRNLGLPIYHQKFNAAMADTAMYERVKFSSGQKVPLPIGRGVARIVNDITAEQIHEALDVWRRRCAEVQ